MNTTDSSGKIGLPYLERIWAKAREQKSGFIETTQADDWMVKKAVLDLLKVGLEPAMQKLYADDTSFDEFEDWVLNANGGSISRETIEKIEGIIKAGTEANSGFHGEPVLSESDLSFFDENGYVIVKNAVPPDVCKGLENVIYNYLEIEKDDPATWHRAGKRQGIMVQMFQNEYLDKTRHSKKIRRAFEQLWSRTDLIPTTDRVSFNPPQTRINPFPGPHLHWDAELVVPFPFGLQGLMYITDTAANQGAFTLVPGFQHKIDAWLTSLNGADPQMQDLNALGPKPIAGEAGDFIIWHHALPHGSSPNTHHLPRLVQYLTWYPVV